MAEANTYLNGCLWIVQATLKHKEGCYGNECNHSNQETSEQALVCLLTVHAHRTVGYTGGQGCVARPALGDLYSHILVHPIQNASSYDADKLKKKF